MRTLLSSTETPSVEVDRVKSVPARNTHRFAWLTVTGLSQEQNTVSVDVGMMGMKRIDALTVQPLDLPFGVAWDGDTESPNFTFDGWVDEARILVECYGV